MGSGFRREGGGDVDVVGLEGGDGSGEGGEAYPWATAFNTAVKAAFEAGDHEALVNWVGLAEDAQMSVPTDEHYLPLLYVAAQQKPGEPVAFFNDAIEGGSISMTGVRIG